ncbi:MAG: hypothetical protein MI810_08085 [Flavobacteriales bacterium]|nr:hypothetical protein [Flavobacteriales bacterium]
MKKKDQHKILDELRKRVIEKDQALKEKKEQKDLLKANKEALLEMTELSKKQVNEIEKEILDEYSRKAKGYTSKRKNELSLSLKIIIALCIIGPLVFVFLVIFSGPQEDELTEAPVIEVTPEFADGSWQTNAWNPSVHFSEKNRGINCYGCNHAQWFKNFAVKPNTNYQLSFLIKVEEVMNMCFIEDSNNDYPWGANVWVHREEPYLNESAIYYGTHDWQEGNIDFNSGEGDSITVHLQVGGHAGLTMGKAWFNSVELREI